MEIKIDLSKPNTVKQAIKALENVKKVLLNQVVDELARECYVCIKELANRRLRLNPNEVGETLIDQIEEGWVLNGSKGYYVMSNVADKAVYIEFGVGITGSETPHPHAKKAQYEYNRVGKKLNDSSWIFRVGDIDLVDIGEKYVMTRSNGEFFYESGRTIRTKGQPATMYLYNALLDFVNSEEPQRIWSKISLKYFG